MLHANLIWRCKTSKIGSQVAGWNIHRDQSRKEMLIMTPSEVYKTKNVRRRPELKRKDFEFFTTFVEGYAVDTEPSSGRDGSRCTSRRHDRPDASARTIPWSWWRQRPWTEQPSGCTWVIRRAEILLQHELSWMQISDDGHDCTRAH